MTFQCYSFLILPFHIHTLVCMQENFCNNMMESVGLSLFGQRIRYKLPFEKFIELNRCILEMIFSRECV
ncbi:hypothetical protein AtNW77_Chr3g0188901 [Arabidopsis thaliana]